MNQLEPIPQVSYLTAGNAAQYRTIMRIFYEEYEKMRFQLYQEDVLEKLHRISGFEDYTLDQLKSDLNMLVTWKNLTPLQDPRKVYSIADYKNKQYKYSMSEYAVEIERLTGRMQAASYKEVNQWWRSLQEDFKVLGAFRAENTLK